MQGFGPKSPKMVPKWAFFFRKRDSFFILIIRTCERRDILGRARKMKKKVDLRALSLAYLEKVLYLYGILIFVVGKQKQVLAALFIL